MENSIKLQIKVIPQSKFNKVEPPILDSSGNSAIKVRVTAPAVDGKANDAVLKLLTEFFQIKKSQIEIASGHTTRQKVIKLFNINKDTVSKNSQLNLL